DKRNISVAKSFMELCGAAGITVGILGKEEKCCGEPVRKIGNEYLYQTTAKENIELIKSYGVRKIVTACPHCFNTLDRDYRDFGFDADISVEHHTVFLNRLLDEGRIKLKPESFNATYHDSCYIGRYNDIYQQPRSLVAATGGRISEMSKNLSESFCCGAGGGRIIADEKIGTRINASRVKMAHETKAEILVSNCPFCLTMFEDGIKTADLDDKLLTKDIAEIMAERL
ncbi:MAG: (Fe-S)-binding protein, partial [Nitrospinota bacterium]